MKESDTYQAILEEGFQQGLKQRWNQGYLQGMLLGLLLVGRKRFGEPDADTLQRIENEPSLFQVEHWLTEVGQINSWADLSDLSR